MRIQTLTRILCALLSQLVFLSTILPLGGCGGEQAAPPGKPGAAPETPSKPGSNYMKEMQNAAAEQAKNKTK
jgi:hypothetical protein